MAEAVSPLHGKLRQHCWEKFTTRTDRGQEDIVTGRRSRAACVWEPGFVVKTPYGWGTLRRYRGGSKEGTLEVRLEWKAMCYIRPQDIQDRYKSILVAQLF